jgi:hypothetical protein
MFNISRILFMPARYTKSDIRALRKRRAKIEALREMKKAQMKRLFPQPQAQWFHKRKFKELVEAQKVKEYYAQHGIP